MGFMQSTIRDAVLGVQQLGERTLSSPERGYPQRDALDRPHAVRDDVAAPAPDEQTGSSTPTRDVVQRVRELLAACPERPPEMDAMARALSMSARTLRRHLLRAETSYRELVDELRLARAIELLRERAPLGVIAARVGYANLPGFLQAFKRMTGLTPTEYRKRRLETVEQQPD